MADKYKPWVTFALGPHAVYTVSKKASDGPGIFPRRRGCSSTCTSARQREKRSSAKERYGLSPVEFLSDQGVLSERFVGAHGCWLSEADGRYCREQGQPGQYARLQSQAERGKDPPYQLVRDKGIPFCLGTDGCSSNNHLDMFGTMKFASLLAKFSTNDPTFLPARQTFEIASSVAARHISSW